MWHRVQVVPSDPSLATAVAAQMFSAGAGGVQEDGTQLITHLPPELDPETFLAAVRVADPALKAEHVGVEDVDWSERWRDRITVHRIGALTVAPPWLAEGLPEATTVVIEPAMAFGTGEHPTTRSVVRLMQGVISPGDAVADVGAGSAILAIAAVKLGASRVFAIESDADAISNAEENVARNGVAGRVAVLEGDAAVLLPLVAPVRVVVANIISSVLLELLPAIARALPIGGTAILSGILLEERVRMVEQLTAAGWRVVAEDREAQWWTVRVTR